MKVPTHRIKGSRGPELTEAQKDDMENSWKGMYRLMRCAIPGDAE